MPVFKSGVGQAPEWCELESFDIVRLNPGQSQVFMRKGPKEKLIVIQGSCDIWANDEKHEAGFGTNLDLNLPGGNFEVTDVKEESVMVRMCGRWGDEIGGSGAFIMDASENPNLERVGADYEKNTELDCHYHDGDEYWIISEGRGIVFSEGKLYEVGPGDCLATGMGHMHDFVKVIEPVRGVYFETSLEARKREGHLWPDVHGKPEGKSERV
jgi:mannose-6-phosphate isomerase-like protein (cupin superfamily)